jgi:hypothetical protein
MLGLLSACGGGSPQVGTEPSEPINTDSPPPTIEPIEESEPMPTASEDSAAFGMDSESSGPFYNIGQNAAESSAMSAWGNLGKDCQKIPAFVQLIEDSMDDVVADIGTKYEGESANEFGSGYLEGLSSVLDDVRAQCQEPDVADQLDGLVQVCREKLSQ